MTAVVAIRSESRLARRLPIGSQIGSVVMVLGLAADLLPHGSRSSSNASRTRRSLPTTSKRSNLHRRRPSGRAHRSAMAEVGR
jgi:hypothetical protein